MYLLGHPPLLHSLLSNEFPLQLLPNLHVLNRLSVPEPQVTEQLQLVHEDQTTIL